MTPEDHADLIREFVARTPDLTGTDRARLLGVGQSTVRRWVAAIKAGEQPIVPLTANVLESLMDFLDGTASVGSPAQLRAMAVRLRQEADRLDGAALALERA